MNWSHFGLEIKPAGYFIRQTSRRGKTGLRTVPLKESIIYLNEWLRVHPVLPSLLGWTFLCSTVAGKKFNIADLIEPDY